ncbi:MAG: methyl-accepting chemotaxis protein [Burkholderiales bacterium]|nr:methyl-accepting chemotaxis protein [Burkholderiales bacterium]
MRITMPDIKGFLGKRKNKAKTISKPEDAAPTPAPAQPSPQRSLKQPRGLLIIGRWPVARQFQVLLGLISMFLLLAAASVYINYREAQQNNIYISTATEMQMLSQRIANSTQQATQGNPIGFTRLEQSREQFITNLDLMVNGGEKLGVSIPPSPDAIQSTLRELSIIWRTMQGDINLVLSQKQNLLDLKALESAIEKILPQLSLRSQELMIAAIDAGESARVLTYTRQLHADVSNYDFINTLRLLSTDNPNPQVALQLGNNVGQFQHRLNVLLGEAKDANVTAISSAAAKERAAALNKVFSPFSKGVRTIIDNMEALTQAKLSGRDTFTTSEDLLTIPEKLVEAYQLQGARQIYYISGAVLFALLALACLFLLGKVFLDDARRRALSSEMENKRNQEAILRLLDEMGRVADGDLTVQALVTEDITGAIADSINYTIEELRRLVAGITKAATQVTSATGEAQQITTQLLEANQKQSSEIQATGQSVMQIVNSINDVSNTAAQSAKVAEGSLSAAEKGTQAVQNAIRGMNDIREQIQETSKRIKRLGESSQEIGEIVQLITDITEQTNVLALNAAIQAASAGEAGRGFTVVAEEVQRLAERSAEATKHISDIVKSIQRDTQDAVVAMERSTVGVVDGTKTADEAGQTLHEIERVSTHLAELIGSISNATQEQAKSAVKVAADMKGILNITQQATEGTKKTAASATQLTALANDLKNSVSGFKLS